MLVFEVCGRELVQKSVLRFSRHLKTISQISFIVRFAPDLSRAHHERSELPDGHDGFMNVYVLISAVAIELHGGAEVEGGDHGAGATHAVGAVHQSWAVAGKEAMYINLNQTQYFIIIIFFLFFLPHSSLRVEQHLDEFDHGLGGARVISNGAPVGESELPEKINVSHFAKKNVRYNI